VESAKFCDPLVNAMTDEGMAQLMKAGPNEVARGLVVTSLNTHGNEMYGTIACRRESRPTNKNGLDHHFVVKPISL
jgi:hypothetical protein